ncbi:MAG: hypothetical protein ACLUUJ_04110 [Acutalibacteraceae bacterium]
MYRHLGGAAAGQRHHAQIRNDERIDANMAAFGQKFGNRIQFIPMRHHIAGDMHAFMLTVAQIYRLAQFIHGKVRATGTHPELLPRQIHSVGTI